MIGERILSGIQAYTKYGRYLEYDHRIETWNEITDRNMQMHIDVYGSKLNNIIDDVREAYESVRNLHALPSMRSMQFAGKPIIMSPNRIFNCSYMPIDALEAFSEAMFLLLGGSGVGYSVQSFHVSQLPKISKPERYRRFVIGDSKEGWADAVKVLFKAYFGLSKTIPRFDYSDIREKGVPLKTSGGKAPGAKPLRDCLNRIESLLIEKKNGEKLKPIEAHDIMCLVGDAVLSGGIRRAALISLFSRDDKEMLLSKTGNWYETHPFRARSNNSAVLPRNEVSHEEFVDIFSFLQGSGYGEPGFYFTNNIDWGTNPCAEISLKSNQFCNLTNVPMAGIRSQTELLERIRAATLIGTLQSGYTDFHYLRERWKDTTENEVLLGIGLTGIASVDYKAFNLKQGADYAKKVNLEIANVIGISPADRLTCVKPDGNTSVLLNQSPGVHAWHSEYFLRRVRLAKTTNLYQYLSIIQPNIIEDDLFNENESVVTIPVKSPSGATLKDNESALELLERVKYLHKNWILPGHVKGDNTHNVSCTVNVKDDEWKEVAKWFWRNRNYYNGLSILPHNDHKYKQAPYESIEEKEFKRLSSKLSEIDWKEVVDLNDVTSRQQEIACHGGACEI